HVKKNNSNRMGVRSISQTVQILGCSKTAVSRVYREWYGSHKTLCSRQQTPRRQKVRFIWFLLRERHRPGHF
uniref:Transposase Tc1-like domain-containing protein n=1 Tax=Cynoglossus semilaevis TaxID=244447 RepID=A0A3P8VXH5_CYNSE